MGVKFVFLHICCVLFFVEAFQPPEDVQLVNSLVDYLNNQPSKAYSYVDGVLINAQKKDSDVYSIDADIRVSCEKEPCSASRLKCHGEIQIINNVLTVLDDGTECERPQVEFISEVPLSTQNEESSEVNDVSQAKLTHEVQLNDQYTSSGEQFVAVRRDMNHNGDWCAGCPTDVNLKADGVADLVTQAISHLDKHIPNVKHSLNKLVRVQRQAQVVNGIRYIVLMEVDSTSCEKNDVIQLDDDCQNSVTTTSLCQVTFLEKPWLKLQDGSKYRDVIVNNCTEEYIFGENSEADLIYKPDSDHLDPTDSENVKVIHNQELQTVIKPKIEKEITPEMLKNIQEQIITRENSEVVIIEKATNIPREDDQQKVIQVSHAENQPNVEIDQGNSKNLETDTQNIPTTISTLSNDKKEAFDGLLDLFGFDQQVMSEPFAQQETRNTMSNAESKLKLIEELNYEDKKITTKRNVPSSESESSEEKKKNVHKKAHATEYKKPIKVDSSDSHDSSEEIHKLIMEPVTLRYRRSLDMNNNIPVVRFSSESNSASSEEKKKNIHKKAHATEYKKPVKVDSSDSHDSSEEIHKRIMEPVTLRYRRSLDMNNNKPVVRFSSESNSASSEEKKKNIHKKAHATAYKKPVKVDSSDSHDSSEEVHKLIMEPVTLRYRRSLDMNNDKPVVPLSSESNSASSEEKKKNTHKKAHATEYKKPVKVDSSGENSSEEKLNRVDTPNAGRNKRSTKGANKNHVNKPYLQSLAMYALNTLDEFDSDDMKRIALQIISSKKIDNPASETYLLKIKVANSKCLESDENNENCVKMLTNDRTKICNIEIEVQSNGNKKVLKSNCVNNTPLKRYRRQNEQLRGGPKKIKLPNTNIKNLALQSVNHFDLTSSSENRHKVVQIISATEQIVSGKLTKIKLEIKESNCPKGNNLMKDDECEYLENATSKFCTSKIWSQPWLNSIKFDLDCHPDVDSRSKRSTKVKPGAPVPIDLPNDEVDQFTTESLTKFDLNSDLTNHHKVVRIVSATRQPVAGTLTKIHFEIKETDCPKPHSDHHGVCEFKQDAVLKKCLATIWNRPWLTDGKEIKVQCAPVDETTRRKRNTEIDDIQKLQKLLKDQMLFDRFLAKFKRTYTNNLEEYRKRFKIFSENLEIIDDLNKFEMGTAKYGLNMFGDISTDEFRSNYLGLRTDLRNHNSIPMPHARIPTINDPPIAFDWRDEGAVTPVKNQGSCGSCWAFSVTGNIEGQWKIKNGNLLSLSEQELVDCDKLDEGCNGGLPDNAYRAIEELGGLELETDYPYDAEDEKCSFNKTLARVQISGAVNISTNEEDMMKWLLQNGPISIGINANAMQFYMGGISHPLKFLCSPKNLDHGVLIVGYGIHEYPLFKKKLPFWIVKNSWGTSWGEKGYYRVFRGDGTCGLNMMASSAVI